MNNWNPNHKDRTLQQVHHRIQDLKDKAEKHWVKNSAWFDSTPEIFMGITPDGRRIIFDMNHDEKSHHCAYPVGHNNWFYRALKDSELPVHINKATDNGRIIIEKRLKGELKEIPIMQDLVDQKEKLDHKYHRIHQLMGAYEEILINHLYNNRTYNKYDITDLILLSIEGYTYFFSATNGSHIKLIRDHSVERIQV